MIDHEAKLREALDRDEGEVLHLYYDSRGIATIGKGCNLQDVRVPDHLARQITIPKAASDELAELRLQSARRDVEQVLPWATGLDPVRRGVLDMLSYNMGIGSVRAKIGLVGKNPRMLAAMERGDHAEAARELLDGPYKAQVGARAHRLARQLETGEWQ